MMKLLLSVGCNSYEHLDPLHGAERDAEHIYDLLVKGDGDYDAQHSRLLLSPSLQELKSALDEIFSVASPVDVLTFFFAGHSGIRAGNYYLCLADTNGERLSTTGLPLVDLFAFVSELGPRQVNVVLDACQSSGAMLDMSPLMKPDIIGEVNSLSISFLAASATNQYAYEENQSGIVTTHLLEYLVGGKMLQDTRPFLDLVELGRAVSADVQNANADQTPVAWGLNLYGHGEFAPNPHFTDQRAELRSPLANIAPRSEIGITLQKYADALWNEHRLIVADPSTRRLTNMLQLICDDLEGNGLSALPFIRGISSSLLARSKSSPDLLASSDVLACCAVSLLPWCQRPETQALVRTLLTDRAEVDAEARRSLAESIESDKFALLSPTNAFGDFYYLPLRVSKTLGWLATSALTAQALGISEPHQADVRRLFELIINNYAGAIVAMSDEQASHYYLFVKACQIYGWDALARPVLQKLFESMTGVGGAVSNIELEPARAFTYTMLRGLGQPTYDLKLIANPSQFIASLLFTGAAYGMASEWNPELRSLDGKFASIYLPDDYAQFGLEVIPNGNNYTYQIGHGVWTLEEAANDFDSRCRPNIEQNQTIELGETRALCVLSSYLFPDRIAYFLESINCREADGEKND